MSNTSTTKNAGNNAGAAEEAPFNKTVNGEPAFFEAEAAEAIISLDTSDESKRRENQLRRMAAKMGLVVKKSRRKHATDADKGLYGLFNFSGNAIAGETYNLSLDELSKAISDRGAAADADNTAEKAAEATQTEKEATPHTGNSENTEQKPEAVKETYNELLGLDYEKMAADYKIRNWISFVDIEEPIYSGVEMEKVIMDSEHTLRLSVCVDLLREIMNKGCGGPVEFGTICRIIGEYMETSYEVAMECKKAKAGQEA